MSLSLTRLAAGLSTAACLLPAPGLEAQNGKDLFNGLDAAIELARTTFNVPGIGLAIVEGDSVIYAKGYGVRTLGQSLGGDAKVRGLDVEGLGTFQRVPERPR